MIAACSSQHIEIPLSDYAAIAMISHGYDYPLSWVGKPENCHCQKPSSAPCSLFCKASDAISRITSFPRQNTLKKILSDLSKGARSAELGDIFFGAGHLMYFFNSSSDDQIIREYFRHDTLLLRLFFRYGGCGRSFAWIYNRPDSSKWIALIDSINGNMRDWDLSEKIDSLAHISIYRNALVDPFRPGQSPLQVKNWQMIRGTIVSPFIVLEHEINNHKP